MSRPLALIIFIFAILLSAPDARAFIALRSKTYTTNTSTTVTPAEPAGAAQNDILFIWMEIQGDQVVTTPTGWTELYHLQSTPNFLGGHLYWIRRGSSAPSYVISWTGGAMYYEVSVTAWSGVRTNGSPFDVTNPRTPIARNPSNPNCPAVLTTVPNTVVINFGMGWTGWTTVASPPAGYTIAEAAGPNLDLAVAYIAKPAAGAENPGPFSGQASGSNDVLEITVALAPALTIKHKVTND